MQNNEPIGRDPSVPPADSPIYLEPKEKRIAGLPPTLAYTILVVAALVLLLVLIF